MKNRLWRCELLSRNHFIFSGGRRETASGFYPFGDATALAGESGGGDVVWMIQAPTTNQKNRPFGLWFVVCLKSDMPQH